MLLTTRKPKGLVIPCRSWEFWESLLFDLWWPQADDLGHSLDILLFDLWWPQTEISGILWIFCSLTSGDPKWRSWDFWRNFAFWPLVTLHEDLGNSWEICFLTSGDPRWTIFDLWWPDMTSGLYNYKNCCYGVYKPLKRFLQIYLLSNNSRYQANNQANAT